MLRVEHIGSTAFPGLIAKPLLDLMPLLKRFEDGFDCVVPLRAHFLVEGSKEARRHLAVRDVLRSNSQWCARYAALKRGLAARFGDDREGYAMAKSDFMRELFAFAGVEGEEPGAGRGNPSSV